PLPPTWLDPDFEHPPMPRAAAISAQNREVVAALRHLLLPAWARLAFPRRSADGPGLVDGGAPGAAGEEARAERVATPRGEVILRDRVPASLVEAMTPAEGLNECRFLASPIQPS